MKIPIYQVDAFAEKLFEGNPAAVCPLENWLEDNMLQSIAAENNLSETAFFVKENNHFNLRWFTPKTEVDLCGHATLASAFVIFNLLNFDEDEINFQTKSGLLKVYKKDELITLNFPSFNLENTEAPKNLINAIGKKPQETFFGKDYFLVYEKEEDIISINPKISELKKINSQGFIITAEGRDCDFVSRYFAPSVGIDEDPVTGSIHTVLIPFWSKRLNKNEMIAKQLSRRKGKLYCKDLGNRVEIAGKAILYLKGELEI
ncbi:MAG: PhzF family phenazine biosynthesis protein [Ignavibacterium sp.]